MKKFILSALVIASALGMTSCEDYLDVNENPNSPSVNQLDAGMIFPGAELAFANQYGVRLRIFGGYYSQYYSQLPGTSNFLTMAGFTMTSALNNNVYSQLCLCTLNNMNVVRNLAIENEDWGTYLAATVIRVASYQVMVDCYGSIPYSEGMDITNPAPKYDEGSEIYPALVSELNEALAKATDASTVCTNFLFKGENATNWIRTANALKLRLLMRMSGTTDVTSQVGSLVAENNFPKSDVTWVGFWEQSEGQCNPFYTEEFYPGRQNNVSLNVALERAMESAMDARLNVYWNPNKDNDIQGWVSSSNGITSSSKYFSTTLYSRPNIVATSPVYFITVAETEFFISEYYQKIGNTAEAKAHFEAGVEASFTEAGLSAGAAQSVLEAFPYDATNYTKNLGIQKWLHFAGTNPFEGYCEVRRLGYPAFGATQGTDIYDFTADNLTISALEPGELYTPIQVDPQVGANQILQRWPYPSSSMNTNSNTPTFAGPTVPIFWAK